MKQQRQKHISAEGVDIVVIIHYRFGKIVVVVGFGKAPEIVPKRVYLLV